MTAIKAAGLVDTLKGPGPFTVFAPTDEAFAKLPAGTVESLLKPSNKKKLVKILTYHVVPGKVMSAALAGKKAKVKTVEGSQVSIDASNGVKVDNAKVTKADIEGRVSLSINQSARRRSQIVRGPAATSAFDRSISYAQLVDLKTGELAVAPSR